MQASADAAIPKSQAGAAPGDVIVLNASGRLPAVDGSLLTNVTTSYEKLTDKPVIPAPYVLPPAT
ncbi:hypothetical protein WM24_01650 [Burkholderia ubonensis]|nr:hypothetical protein WM24_01650 [Burkholderia ubonensis]